MYLNYAKKKKKINYKIFICIIYGDNIKNDSLYIYWIQTIIYLFIQNFILINVGTSNNFKLQSDVLFIITLAFSIYKTQK